MQPYVYYGYGIKLGEVTEEEFDQIKRDGFFKITWFSEECCDQESGIAFIDNAYHSPWDEDTTEKPSLSYAVDTSDIDSARMKYLPELQKVLDHPMVKKYNKQIKFYVCCTEV